MITDPSKQIFSICEDVNSLKGKVARVELFTTKKRRSQTWTETLGPCRTLFLFSLNILLSKSESVFYYQASAFGLLLFNQGEETVIQLNTEAQEWSCFCLQQPYLHFLILFFSSFLPQVKKGVNSL